jgi:hypothetical protein
MARDILFTDSAPSYLIGASLNRASSYDLPSKVTGVPRKVAQTWNQEKCDSPHIKAQFCHAST